MKYKFLISKFLSGIIYIAIIFKCLCKAPQQINHSPTQTKFIAQFVQLA